MVDIKQIAYCDNINFVIKLRNYFKKEEYPFFGMSKEKNVTSEDLQNSSVWTKKTTLQYLRKRGLHEVSK